MINIFLAFLLFLVSSSLWADSINITPDMHSVEISIEGKNYTIDRIQEPDIYLINTYSLTSRPSPPFFIEPFKVSEGVETYGELEVLDFLKLKDGILIDARLPNWYEKSYIAGSINIPFKIFLSDSPERDKILKEFGGEKSTNTSWDFENAKKLLFYCNGAWCGQSPTAIKALMKIGYPEKKIKYYRGGMQAWQLLGLTIIIPKKEVSK